MGLWNNGLEFIQIKLFKIYLKKFPLSHREEFTQYVFNVLKPFFSNRLFQSYLHRYILNNGKVGINCMSIDALAFLKRNAKKRNPIDYKVFLFYFKDRYPLSNLIISNLDLYIRILKKNLPKFKTNYRKPLIEHYISEVKDEDYWAPKLESYENNKFYYYLFLREKLKQCLRESENQLRENLGYKRIGEGNVQEHTLYKELIKIIEPRKIKRWYRPAWLGGLELDFYFEKDGIKYAIEYQGAQHVRPIDYFGGKRAFRKQIKRDKRKLNLCMSKNVKLLYCYYDDCLHNFIKVRLEEHLKN
ncbi:hypothetical protein CH368_08600 [Leptospira levettii]|nr:hypothetical protein CH368_08600 [Leptospira levettii]